MTCMPRRLESSVAARWGNARWAPTKISATGELTLAAAQDGMPPLCAQDFVLSGHGLPAHRAAQLLIREVGAQSEGSGNGEHIVLDPGALTAGARSRQVLPDTVAVTSADTQINAAVELLSTSVSAATRPAEDVWRSAVGMLRAAVHDLMPRPGRPADTVGAVREQEHDVGSITTDGVSGAGEW